MNNKQAKPSPKPAEPDRGNDASKTKIARRAPGRPTHEAAEALHEIFLQTALDVFLAEGYAGASIEEIARQAKASKVTIYRQFGSKAELFRAATQYAQFKVAASLDAIPMEQEGDPEQLLFEIILRLTDAYMDPEYIGVWRLAVAEARRFPEAGLGMMSSSAQYLDRLIRCIGLLDKKGVIAVGNPHAAAVQLAGMVSGGVRFLIRPPPQSREERRKWAAGVHKLFWNSWRHAAGHPPPARKTKPD